MTEERKRATRACDECRRLKEKCEGGIPCSRCSHFHRLCEFKSRAQRVREFRPYVPSRPQVARGDVRGLVQRSRYMERILRHTVQGISLDTSSLSKLADALTTSKDTHRATSPVAEEADSPSIDDEACTLDPVGDTTTHFSGEFSYWNFSMRIKHQIEQQTRRSVAQHIHNADQRVFEYWRAQHLRSSQSYLSAAISCCPPPQIARFLANVFFKYAETHYFFIRKSWLLENLNALYNDPSSFSRKGAAVISIILTVFAIGTQYAYLDSPGNSAGTEGTQDSSEDDIGNTFYQNAVRLLPEIIELSSLESVQACLLFGFYSLPIDASGLGYIYVNLAVRLAMQNGMHRKCKSEAFNSGMIETRNRVWWAAYSLERKISIFHGRPLSVLKSDVDTELPQDREERQPEDFPYTVARSVTSIQLIHFLEDFFHELSLLRNCGKGTVSSIISRLRDKKSAMKGWWDSLPVDVLGEIAPKQTQDRAAMHLRLEYCLVNMFIGRPFLLRDHTSQSHHGSPSEPQSTNPSHDHSEGTDGESPKQTSSTQGLIAGCVQAAKEAIGVCQLLRDNRPGLARASYIEYSSCRASLLVLIAYSIQTRSEELRQPLLDGLKMIREMSATGDSARSEVALIEALECALVRLHSETQTTMPAQIPSEPVSSMSDYDAFKQWGSLWKSVGNLDILENVPVPSFAPPAASPFPVLPLGHLESNQISYLGDTIGLGASSSTSSRDIRMDPLNAWDPGNELSIFDTGNPSLASAWPTQTETHLLEQFLAVPESSSMPRVGIDGQSGFEQIFNPHGSQDNRASQR